MLMDATDNFSKQDKTSSELNSLDESYAATASAIFYISTA
jgi:hypothetical protein